MTPDQPLRMVGKRRAEGERRSVRYDPKHHPGIVYRLFRLGLSLAEVAAAVGVTPEVMERWLETRPELKEARALALRRDAEILVSIEDHAIGKKDPVTGRYSGGNPMLLKFLAQTRLGMVKPKERKREDRAGERFDGMTADQLHRQATMLKRKLAKVEELQEAVEKPAPV